MPVGHNGQEISGIIGAKGMVLAAGLGKRLMPLTERYPKPLVPFAGTTPLALALWRLNAAGIRKIAINSHHQSDLIADFIKVSPSAANLMLSHEPVLLGTGGAYNPLRAWLGDDDLVALNGDVVATLDLGALVNHHRATGAVATMALLPHVIPGESGVHYQDGRVLGISREAPRAGVLVGNYACAQVLSRAFLELLPKTGVFDVITSGYRVALERGLTVGALPGEGYWHDLRTPQFYWEAIKELLTSEEEFVGTGVAACRQVRGLRTVRRTGVLTDASSHIATSAKVGPMVMVEPGTKIGEHAEVRNALLLPGAVIGNGEVVENAIVGPGLRVPLVQP